MKLAKIVNGGNLTTYSRLYVSLFGIFETKIFLCNGKISMTKSTYLSQNQINERNKLFSFEDLIIACCHTNASDKNK